MTAPRAVGLEELTPIGFGCYRVDVRSAQHREALTRALTAGCNLIDTASNYTDGRSEELVGEVLETTQARAFVVTKAGYVSPGALAHLARAGIRVGDLSTLASGTPFSLEPSVLRVVLELSRARLRRRTLDAVLLHNPERLREAGASANALSGALERAFAFLEEEVAAGRLRFYGVSSNDLPSTRPGDILDLETLVELSARSGQSEGLAFIQFPLNLLERQAATATGRPSLLARSGNVRTIANRPFNALAGDHPVRLAGAECDSEGVPIDDPWDHCVELVATQLAVLGELEPWTSFRPMQFLRDNRNDIPDHELVDEIFANQIDPFVVTLFGQDPPAAVRAAFQDLRAHAHSRTHAHLAERTNVAVARLAEEGLLQPQSDEPLAVAACRYCLATGVDHVLVGMRRPEYVAQLATLFSTTSSSAQ